MQTAVGYLNNHALQKLNLSGSSDFDGAVISITVAPKNSQGDGFVDVGRINASGRVLSSVTIDGDLGEILGG